MDYRAVVLPGVFLVVASKPLSKTITTALLKLAFKLSDHVNYMDPGLSRKHLD